MLELKKHAPIFKTSQWGRNTSSSSPTKPVLFPADLNPQQNPWLDLKIVSRLWKRILRPSPCSSRPPEFVHVHGLFQFFLKLKRLKTRNPNPSFG